MIDVSREGWVQCDLVTEATGENAAAVMVKDLEGSLPVRALPQYNSAVVTQVRKADTRLYFTGVTEQGAGLNQELCDWYQVEVSNAQKGWVQADFVREIEP